MSQYRVSDTARADLNDIWFYIAQDSPKAADRFVTTRFVSGLRATKLAALRHGVAIGVKDLAEERFENYSTATLVKLVDENKIVWRKSFERLVPKGGV